MKTWRRAVADSGRPYDAGRIEKAYEMAAAAHAGQTRLSGESYVSHPVAVACLVVDLGLDTDSVVAALLHDVVEDTPATARGHRQAVWGRRWPTARGRRHQAGPHASTPPSEEEQQAKTCARCCMAMAKDVRVILIKLCDRLHNMRTRLYAGPSSKQPDKALETMEIYAPIAHRSRYAAGERRSWRISQPPVPGPHRLQGHRQRAGHHALPPARNFMAAASQAKHSGTAGRRAE